MNLVETCSLYMNYSHEKVFRVVSLLESAANRFGIGTDGYITYLAEHTQNGDENLRDFIMESQLTEYKNTSNSHEYMGVTVYKNPDKTYSCPEAGIYGVRRSSEIKAMIRDKKARKQDIKENIELVIDNIFYTFDLTESEFIEYILENITIEEYEELGGYFFQDFVNVISEIAGIDTVANSLINEGYLFDEGIGDFVRGVSDKLASGVDRHNAASAKFGAALSTPKKTTSAVGNKIKTAVGKTFNKKNAQTVGAVVNAAASSVNKLAGSVARGAEIGAKTFDNINTDALETKRAELRAKNAEDPKAKIDREAESAPSSQKPPTKKLTSKEKEALYDKTMKEDTLYDIKEWLIESDIFDSIEEVDSYILDEMTVEDMIIILDSLDEGTSVRKSKEVRKAEADQKRLASIAAQKTKMDNDDVKAKFRQVDRISNNAEKENETSRISAQRDISRNSAMNHYRFQPSKRAAPSTDIRNDSKKINGTSSVAKSKPTEGKSLASRAVADYFTNNTPTRKPLGNASKPPKDRTVLVPQPNKKSFADKLSDVNSRPRPAGYGTNKPMPQLQVPQPNKKEKTPEYRGYMSNGKYTMLSTDNMVSAPSGHMQRGRTKSKIATAPSGHMQLDRTKSKIATAAADNSVKPSSVVSSFTDKAKNYAKKLFKKLNPLKESAVINWLTDDEILDTICCLVESGIFGYEEELLEYLNYDMSWDEANLISEYLDDVALDILVECFYDEYDNSQEILSYLLENIGENYYEYILEEEVGNDSTTLSATNTDPIVNKRQKKNSKNVVTQNNNISESSDCACGKDGCKSCKKTKWKSDIYSKIRGK